MALSVLRGLLLRGGVLVCIRRRTAGWWVVRTAPRMCVVLSLRLRRRLLLARRARTLDLDGPSFGGGPSGSFCDVCGEMLCLR